MDHQTPEDILAESVTIPTLPSVVHRINKMLEDPEVSIVQIGAEVSKDAPISTKVLRIANSAFYGLREQVISTEHASCVLGLQVLRNIVMQASVIGRFDHLDSNSSFDLESMWRHSILAAETCQKIASATRVNLGMAPEEFHTTGLLHDVGQVVLLDTCPDRFLEAVDLADRLGVDLAIAEQELMGFDHAAIGARVANRWGLPPLLEQAIADHHLPLTQLKEPAVLLVAVSNRICERVPTEDRQAVLATFEPVVAERLGIDEVTYARIVDSALSRYPALEV